MQNISENVKRLYKTQNSSTINKNYKIVIDEAITLNNSEIVYGSFQLSQVICSSETLRFGESNSSMIKFQCASDIGNIKGKEMEVYSEINGYAIPMGHYVIESCEITENRRYRTITGYDNLYRFQKDASEWYAQLTFPITIKNMFQSLCRYFKVGYIEPDFVNGEMPVEKTINAEELLGITVLKSIAELNGGFFRADPTGLVEFITLDSSTAVEEFPVSAYSNLKKEDYKTKKYDRLNIRQETGDIGVSSGTGENAYIIEDNFLVYGKSSKQLKSVADKLFAKISDIQYIPYTATEIGLPYLEPGDYVKYITTTGEFCSFILSRTLTGTQILKDTIVTDGTEETKETFGLEKEVIRLKGKSNVITRSIEETKEKITNLETDIKENYSTTKETLTEITKTAGEIKSTVASTYTTKKEFEQLEIGGRNLALNTTDEYKSIAVGQYYTVVYSAEILDLMEQYNLSEGDNITFSVHIKTESGKQLCSMIQHYNTETNRIAVYGTETSVENREGISYVTTTINTSYKQLRLCVRNITSSITAATTEYYKCVKLEKGNKATDWQPSVEDTAVKISTLSTNYTTLNQSLTSITAEVAGNTSVIATKADSSTVTEVQNNLTKVTADLSGFKTTVSSTYTTKKEFEQLEIGGRNLALNTTDEYKSIAVGQYYTVVYSAEILDLMEQYNLSEGDNITFSVHIKTESGKQLCSMIQHYNTETNRIAVYGTETSVENREGISYVTTTINTSYKQLRLCVRNITSSITNPTTEYYKCVKLEKGTKATDWQPSPEDTANDISTVSMHISTVEQTADKINWLVKSGSSQSNFTLTDRLAELTSEIISLNGNVKVSGDMIVDGAITAKKIATDAIKSRNYVENVTGSYLNLANGSFDSKWLKFSSNGLDMGSVHISNKTDDYGKVKGGLYIEFVNSDTGTVGGHGELYRLYLNPYNLDSGDSGTAIKLLKQDAYDETIIKNIFTMWYSGLTRLDGHFTCTGIIKADDIGAKDTVSGKKIQSTGTEYPNIYGNGTYLHLNHSNENAKGLVCEAASIRPAGDANQSCGRTDKRWSTVYAFTSMISTSDKNEKNTINELEETLVLDFIKGLKPVSYKYNNGTSGRTHMGLISQDIEELLTSLGLDSLDFAGFIKSPKIEMTETERTDENGNPIIETKEQIIENKFNYGLRYEEFISPLIKFVQIQENKITMLDEQVKNQQREIEELKAILNKLLTGVEM